MKTVSVEFPIQEAVDVLRLLRGESRCLLENGDVFQDIDVLKRTQSVMSARERIVTAMEEIAETEEAPAELPQLALNIERPPAYGPRVTTPMDTALAAVTTGEGLDDLRSQAKDKDWVGEWEEVDDVQPDSIGMGNNRW
jgi:hypothetical protein